MADRYSDRDRRGRDEGSNWDLEYDEYRYMPCSPYRGNDHNGCDLHDPDYCDNNMYYGRYYDYNQYQRGGQGRRSDAHGTVPDRPA